MCGPPGLDGDGRHPETPTGYGMTSSPPPPPPRPGAPPPPGRSGGSAPPAGAPPLEAGPKKGRGPLFWMGLGCLGCVTLPILLLALFAGALGGGVFFFSRQPVSVVKAQLAEIREGRLDAAYARFSDRGRERLSRDAFIALVDAHPGLRDNADASFWNRSLNNDRMRLSGTLTARSGAKEPVTYMLVRERGEWKVAAIRFGDDAEREEDGDKT